MIAQEQTRRTEFVVKSRDTIDRMVPDESENGVFLRVSISSGRKRLYDLRQNRGRNAREWRIDKNER
jgi:hypothetical protein